MHVIEDEDLSAFVDDPIGHATKPLIAGGQEPPIRFGNFSDAIIFSTTCPRVLGPRLARWLH
jgi:hypothetical protein